MAMNHSNKIGETGASCHSGYTVYWDFSSIAFSKLDIFCNYIFVMLLNQVSVLQLIYYNVCLTKHFFYPYHFSIFYLFK